MRMTPGRSAIPATRRLAALGALAGTAGLTVVVAAALIGNLLELVFGLVGLALAVAGGWWVATEQKLRRAGGAAAMLIGLTVVAIAVWRTFDGTADVGARLLVLLVVVAFTVACTRTAVAPPADHHPEPRPAGPPRRAVLLCNPWSGGGKVGRFGIVAMAAELGVETVMLEHGLDLETLARDAVARGADCLGMAGGDGSQSVVASVAVEHGLPFVCVSAGTRNHFALDLGLSIDDPRRSLAAFRDAYERRVDFATVNGRLFVNNVSLGVYAKIVHDPTYRDAKVAAAATALPSILGRQAEPIDLQFTAPDGREVDDAIVLMVSNNPYVTNAVAPDAAERRHLDTGRLGVFGVTTRTGGEAARLVAASAIGTRQRSRFWHEFTTEHFEVRSRSGVALAGIDGESVELTTPLQFRSHPAGLTLLVPEGNIEAARRRRARDVRVKDLLDIARGRSWAGGTR